MMCKILHQNVQNQHSSPNKSILLCVESNSSKIQGVAIIDKTNRFLIVQDLVANPDNIRGAINTSTTPRVPGVGTALIAESARTCLSEGKEGVFLKALDAAKGFYEHCGFEAIDPTASSLSAMFLSARKVQTPPLLSTLMVDGASLTPDVDEETTSSQRTLTPTSEEIDTNQPPASSKIAIHTLIRPKRLRIGRLQHLLCQRKRLVSQSHRRSLSHRTPPAKKKNQPQKTIQHITEALLDWKKSCHTLLGNSNLQPQEKAMIKAEKKLISQAKRRLEKVDSKSDTIFACTDKSSLIQGIAHVSRQKNFIVIKSIVLNPEVVFSSESSSDAQKSVQAWDALVSHTGKTCALLGKKWLYVKGNQEEKPLYQRRGFEPVDETGAGKIRMLAAVKEVLQSP